MVENSVFKSSSKEGSLLTASAKIFTISFTSSILVVSFKEIPI